MHCLMNRVLDQRQLNAAGQLFAINHYDVITDLRGAFERIKRIFNDSDYVDNKIDQSVVEIVIARITAAIRETSSIETFCAELVDVLDSALQHPMALRNSYGEIIDSPHCVIANDILNCLFLHYSKRTVMTLTLPVAIKALGCSNPDLVRNTTSYISLAAIHNSKALSNYAIQLISFAMNGNYSLLRVLPQIYMDNKEPIDAHLNALMEILDSVECSEQLSLLQLASSIANYKPHILVSHLKKIDSFLLSHSTCTAVLNIYMSLVSQGKAHLLSPFLPSLKQLSCDASFASSLPTVVKIVSNIGRCTASLADEAVNQLMLSLNSSVDTQLTSTILSEIEGVGCVFPNSLLPHLERLRELKSMGNSRQIDRIVSLAGCSPSTARTWRDETDDLGISMDSLQSAKKTPRNNGGSMISSGGRTLISVCESTAECSQLDKNTHELAMQYQNRSNGSLSRNHSRSHNSMQGPRSTNDNGNISRDLSQSSLTHSVAGASSRTDPQRQTESDDSRSVQMMSNTNIQMGRDGRVRPVGGRRMNMNNLNAYETTFPAVYAGPITTTMLPVTEEDEQNASFVDRSDLVLQFVHNRKNKIRRYIGEVQARFPIPIQCTVETAKGKKLRMIVHFACQSGSEYCVFANENLFAFKTKLAESWIHAMFLQMQSTSLDSSKGEPVGQSYPAFQTLAHCWKCLPANITKGTDFLTLVTSAFPTKKDQDRMLKELEAANFFDCFTLDSATNKWNCFSCAKPDKAKTMRNEGWKVLEGQLKEKKGRWNLLSRWHTKYFTLSSAALTSGKQNAAGFNMGEIDLKSIRSVRSLGRGKKSRQSLRKAFEIFTNDNTSVVLKARDEQKAEEWMQCLQIAVAQAKREQTC